MTLPGPRVLVVDNYDSFTYNLVQYLEILGARCEVFLHDAVDVAEIRRRSPDGLLVSPGPKGPDDAGVSLSAIRALAGEIPILGVCLGHQAIAHAFGGRVVRAARPMHGRTSPIHHDGSDVFEDLPSPFDATRYHSLLVDRATLPSCLRITAWTAEGEIMGLRHQELGVSGVQFHPESVASAGGLKLLGNWLRALTGNRARPQ